MAEALLQAALEWRELVLRLQFSIFNNWRMWISCMDNEALIDAYREYLEWREAYRAEVSELLSQSA